MVNFECRLAPRQLILGRNGSGKSTLFDVLALLRDFCINGELDEKHLRGLGAESRTRWQDVREQTFQLDVSLPVGEFKLELIVDSWGSPEQLRVLREVVTFSGKPIFRFEKGEVHLYNDRHEDKVQYPFNWHRSALATVAERKENQLLSKFKDWLGNLQYISPDPRRMEGIASQAAKYPDQYLSNFADWYMHLRLATEDHEYLADLAEVIDGFVTMRLPEAGERRHEISVRLTSTKNEKEAKSYLLRELSDGQRVLIGLYAMLNFALKPGATLCFDEPDNFIALREIQPWLTKILDRTEGDDGNAAQVLLVSHHPELLNRMAFQEGLLLERSEGRHTRAVKFDDTQQTGLSASELIARGWENE